MTNPRPASSWRKSSHSGNGGNCVETKVTWQKSSRSGNGGNCVEVARIELTAADA
ncbi:DUF397 domain-containing protein [Actinoallomurus iriomotensis]|uniref:DUF397 domain-containing protein n=1 Tax=Actinoallomurus iriomotensis TaxID=478107 RepID=A0A9W6RT80_9ACTN|nr:DUF397 domain-containing protein [Actinoallomurus iriomotensis]GLY81134.1 hypothetical protein Airi01_094010 [Actinoallomurus iriomotensis]